MERDYKWFCVICDKEFIIKEILSLKNIVSEHLITGNSLALTISADNHLNYFNFIANIRKNSNYFGADISMFLNNGYVLMKAAGFLLREDSYLVVAFSNIFDLYEDLKLINNEEAKILRNKLKEYSLVTKEKDEYYDQMMKINNELINTKRELARKNAELTRMLDESKQLNKKIEMLNVTKNRFFSIISHDLKGPISSLWQLMDILCEDYMENDSKVDFEILTAARDTSKHTYHLLEQLLEWSRTQSENILVFRIKIDLKYVIEEILTMMNSAFINKNITVVNNINKSIFVYGDKKMVETILRNLLSNAVKYVNEGGEIEISGEELNNITEIRVKDNGVGMTEEQRKKLFYINENISIKGTKGERGTGLGLILCKEFIEKNNGEIGVISELNKGSTFYFRLPAYEK